MIIIQEKFQAIQLKKRKSELTNLQLNVDDNAITSVSSVELSGITLDDKHNLNIHMGNIYKSAANQLNTLMRFKPFFKL